MASSVTFLTNKDKAEVTSALSTVNTNIKNMQTSISNLDTNVEENTSNLSILGLSIEEIAEELLNLPNYYTWKKYNSNPLQGTETSVSNQQIAYNVTTDYGTSSFAVEYSSEISFEGGKISLVNPITENFNASVTPEELEVLKGKYVYSGSIIRKGYYFIPTDATFTIANNAIRASIAKEITVPEMLGFVAAESYSAYPIDGSQHTDGYYYIYFKKFGEGSTAEEDTEDSSPLKEKELIGEITLTKDNMTTSTTEGIYYYDDATKATMEAICEKLDQGVDSLVAVVSLLDVVMVIPCNYISGSSTLNVYRGISGLSSSLAHDSKISQYDFLYNCFRTNQIDMVNGILAGSISVNVKFYNVAGGGNGNGNSSSSDGENFEQIQSDWEQNDETQVDFIKNKPFEEVEENFLEREITTEVTENQGTCYEGKDEPELLSPLKDCNEIKVIFNSQEYLLNQQKIIIPEGPSLDIFGFGNVYLFGLAYFGEELSEEDKENLRTMYPESVNLIEDTGEDFLFLHMDLGTGEKLWIFFTREAGTYTVKILTSKLNILNPLIETTFQSNYLENDTKSVSYIQNRPFYEENNKTVVSGVIFLNEENNNIEQISPTHAFMITSSIKKIDINSPVSISIDGQEYPCSILKKEGYYLVGNEKFFSEESISTLTPNDFQEGELPIIMAIPEEEDSEDFLSIEVFGFFTKLNIEDFSTGLAFSIKGNIIHKIDSKFIDFSEVSIDASSALPPVTTEDNDKVLMVVNGKWIAASIANGDEVAY